MKKYAGALAVTAAALLAAAAAAPAAWAEPSPSRLWTVNDVVTNHNAAGAAVAVSPDGSTVYTAGTAPAASSPDDGYGLIVAWNAATGAQDWKATLDPGTAWDDGYTSVAVSPDGDDVFVTGYSGKVGATPAVSQVIVAYNATTGAKLWQVTGPADTGESPLAVSPDGATLYVTSAAAGQTTAYATAGGAQLWQDPVGGNALALSADGSTLAVTGSAASGRGQTEALTASTGATIWQATYPAQASFTTIALSPTASSVFVAGTGPQKFITAAYDATTGHQDWAQTAFNDSAASTVPGLAVANGGATLVEVRSSAEMSGGVLVSHWKTLGLAPATGASAWTASFTDPAGAQEGGTAAAALAVSPDGATAYVTGTAAAASGSDFWVTNAYTTASGAKLWQGNYNGRIHNDAAGIAVSPDGSSLFVTGSSVYGGTGATSVLTTVGYSASASGS